MGKINTSLKQDFCKRYTTNIALNGKTGKIKGKEIMKNKESKNYDKAIFLGFFSFFFKYGTIHEFACHPFCTFPFQRMCCWSEHQGFFMKVMLTHNLTEVAAHNFSTIRAHNSFPGYIIHIPYFKYPNDQERWSLLLSW